MVVWKKSVLVQEGKAPKAVRQALRIAMDTGAVALRGEWAAPFGPKHAHGRTQEGYETYAVRPTDFLGTERVRLICRSTWGNGTPPTPTSKASFDIKI